MTRADTSPLLTDLYQLTMMQSYLEHGLTREAVFEFFVRKLPPQRNFLMACGLEQGLAFLEDLRFGDEDLEWLRKSERFSHDFVDYLAGLRFDGDVHAMPEGTIFFPNEPILRLTAPLPLAQLVESRLINLLHFQTLIASKAARVRLAAPGKRIVDFGLRRTHGAEAGLLAARAAYIAGLDGTSNVLAAPRFGIPIFGTMAHSYILAHDSEEEAFLHYARSHPGNVVLLIDTFDTERAAEKVAELAPHLTFEGISIRGVRLDSGDLAAHAFKVRRILDAAGLRRVTIFASGNLDEYRLADLAAKGAPIDGYGVGTRMNTAADAPYLDCAYKLQEYAGIGRRKVSEGKATWPGRKQVYRTFRDGIPAGDILTVEGDEHEGTPLIVKVMEKGKRLGQAPSIEEIRARAVEGLAALPPALRALETAPPYPVKVATALKALAREADRRAGIESAP